MYSDVRKISAGVRKERQGGLRTCCGEIRLSGGVVILAHLTSKTQFGRSSLTQQLALPGSALVGGLEQAKMASDVRHAAIREDYDRARFANIQNLKHELAKSGGILDQQTLRAALGKRQPRQRMLGVSGPVVLGAAFALHHPT